MNVKVFVESTIHVLMTFAWIWHQNNSIFLCLNPECFCLNAADLNFKAFVAANIYEPIMPAAWWRHQNKKIFDYLNVDCIWVFLINFCWLLFLGFCGTSHDVYEPVNTGMLIAYWRLQSRGISFCLNFDCLFLFYKLLLTWNSKSLWKQPYMSLQLGRCLLRNDLIKIGKFLFVWTLIVSISTVVVDMNFNVLVKRAVYEPTITLMFIMYWRHQKIGKFLFCLNHVSSAYLKKNFQTFCVKKLEPLTTLRLVVWWRHQNKNISFFNTYYLINRWWVNIRSFCGRSNLWT